MKKRAIISLMLSVCVLLCSCSSSIKINNDEKNVTSEDVSDTKATSDDTKRLYDNVPSADYEGYTFTFLTKPNDANGYWGHFEFYTEEQNAVPLNDAIYNRNAKIAERFNISFANICEASWENMFMKSVASGEDIYDCAVFSPATAASFAVNGQLLDYVELTNIDLSQPWWDPVLNKQFSIAHKQYFAIGNITLVDKEATYIMMFNKDVANDFGINNLYTIVNSGEWTMDKLMEICAKVTADVDGDGKYTFKDRVGLVTDIGATNQAMFYTGGARFFEKDSDDIPFFSIDMDRATGVMEKIVQITKSNYTMMASTLYDQGVSNPWSDDGINGMFKQGRALFYGISLTVMSKMRDMDSDFGVLPYPKYNEDQKDYISFVGSALADTVAVPMTCENPERTSAIIEALCCESTYSTLPAYYDVTITNKTMRDEESAAQLDYIFAHRTIDMSMIYNWGGIYDMLLSVKNAENFASAIAKMQKTVTRSMEKTIAEFTED
jgi:ABC-type glycerol-3-phosphate transport system substrate-binding protein